MKKILLLTISLFLAYLISFGQSNGTGTSCNNAIILDHTQSTSRYTDNSLNDIWFTFTASTNYVNFKSEYLVSSSVTLYKGWCGNIETVKVDTNSVIFDSLIIGDEYYIKVNNIIPNNNVILYSIISHDSYTIDFSCGNVSGCNLVPNGQFEDYNIIDFPSSNIVSPSSTWAGYSDYLSLFAYDNGNTPPDPYYVSGVSGWFATWADPKLIVDDDVLNNFSELYSYTLPNGHMKNNSIYTCVNLTTDKVYVFSFDYIKSNNLSPSISSFITSDIMDNEISTPVPSLASEPTGVSLIQSNSSLTENIIYQATNNAIPNEWETISTIFSPNINTQRLYMFSSIIGSGVHSVIGVDDVRMFPIEYADIDLCVASEFELKPICYEQMIIPSNGYTYAWTVNYGTGTIISGGTTLTPTVELNGGYTEFELVISNSSTGEIINTQTVVTNSSLSVATTITNASCDEATNGAISTAVTGGVLPYTYNWYNAISGFTSSDANISNIPSGTYALTVTDANGCTVTIDKPDNTVYSDNSLEAVISTLIPNINDNCCASITTNVVDGNPNYKYHWTGPNSYEHLTSNEPSSTESINDLCNGQYFYTVTDDLGCHTEGHINLFDQPCNNPIIQEFICSNEATLTAISPNVIWSTGETTQSIIVTTEGEYSYTGTDANGCSICEQVFDVVKVPDPLTFSTSPNCETNLEDWTWNLTVEGSYANSDNSTYLWNTGETTSTILANSGTTYSVTVTIPGGCSQSESFETPLVEDFGTVSSYNLNLSNPTTIQGGTYFVSENIFVYHGELVLNNVNLYIKENVKIDIWDKGKIINNHSLLSSCSTWEGIIIHGNPVSSNPNSSENSYYKSRYGIIEHAVIAIKSLYSGVYNIRDSYFKNNLQSIKVSNNDDLYNIATLRNTEFSIDNNKRFDASMYYNNATSTAKYQISFFNIKTITSFDCFMVNNATDGTKLCGIFSNGTQIKIGSPYDTAPNSNFVHSTFDNLYIGIYQYGNNYSSTFINDAYFTNVEQAIYMESTNLIKLKRNTIDMAGIDEQDSYGIFLNNCDAPEVTLNTFSNGARGLLISQGDGDYTVYKNTFENFTYNPTGMYASAIVTQGDNTNGTPNSGLQFKCNSFSNNSKSIAVIDEGGSIGKVKQKQGFWLQSQPNIKDPANNVFDNYCQTGDGNDAFFVETNPGFTYTYYRHNNYVPQASEEMDFGTCYTDAFMNKTGTNAIGVTYEEACPDDPNAGTGGGNGGGGGISPIGGLGLVSISAGDQMIGNLNTQIDTKQNDLDAKVDKGNTEILASEINTTGTTDYTEVAQKVSENNGYVSDLVLDEFITKDVGRPVAKTIALVQNSPLPEKAKGKIEQAGLPTDLKNYLKAQQNGISKREQKESEIAHLKSKKQYIFNRLIKTVLADSTLSKADSLLDLMETQSDINTRKQTVKLLSTLGRKEDALQKISELRQDIVNLENMEQLDDILQIETISINAKNLPKAEQTSLYQSNRDLLMSIYNKKDKASVKAYRMLKDLGEEIEAPLDVKLAFPKANSNRTANTSIQASSVESPKVGGWLSLYPNPVKGKLTVEYLLEKDANTDMRIYDINGKVLIQKKFKTTMGIKTIDVSKLPSGVYILKLDNNSKEFVVK